MAGLNGRQFAHAIGWDSSKVSRYENGHQVPSETDVRRWCSVVDGSELLMIDLIAAVRNVVAAQREQRHRGRAGAASAAVVAARLARIDEDLYTGRLTDDDLTEALRHAGLHQIALAFERARASCSEAATPADQHRGGTR